MFVVIGQNFQQYPSLDELKDISYQSWVRGVDTWLTDCCGSHYDRRDNFCRHCGSILPKVYTTIFGIPITDAGFASYLIREVDKRKNA